MYGLACWEEKVKVMWSQWRDSKLFVGYSIELDLTLPSEGIKLLWFLQSIWADGSSIRARIESLSVEQLVASSGQGPWRAPQSTDLDCLPLPPDPSLSARPQVSQLGPFNQQRLYHEYDVDCREADSSDEYEGEELSADESVNPMMVQSLVSSTAAQGDQEYIPDLWVRSHYDRIITKARRAKSLSDQMSVDPPPPC
ncbi:hypothetical protein FRB93_008361 [Tulasnella sp. JGI-2019a]|nr:hypothetical protein FRB93_008361 [Tulasnella sp. JGI-2019a]